MSLYSMLKPFGKSGFGYASTAEDVTDGIDLTGKTYLLTGCNSGLGYESMRVLCSRGATVIGAARTIEKAKAAGESVTGKTHPLACELSNPQSVLDAVKTVADMGLKLDGILCNAGIMMPSSHTIEHGLEIQFLTNHVGHFLLVTGLLELLTDTGRVVMVSSTGHTMTYSEGIRFDDLDGQKKYSSLQAYGQSKLANLLFAKHLATLLKPGQTANSLHPGVIATNLSRNLPGPLTWAFKVLGDAVANKSIPQGAATQLYVLTHPTTATITGTYFSDSNEETPSAHGADAGLAAQLWTKTEAIVAAL